MKSRQPRRKLRVLFVGLTSGTSGQRKRALGDLGHLVETIDTGRPVEDLKAALFRLSYRLRRPLDFTGVNERVVKTMSEALVDLLWVEKVLTLRPSTLAAVRGLSPATKFVFYSPDDMFNPANQSHYYIRSIPTYDLHVTTKSYNVKELREAGARDVLFVNNAFDPHTHKPLALSSRERNRFQADVGFVGAFERDRAAQVLALAKEGLKVTVWSSNWSKRRFGHENITARAEYLDGLDYTKAINATRINLGFLRKCNRDKQTTRTMEIPASGGFLLAERTDEHLRLFEEGKEAEFFSTPQELVTKCCYYLEHEKKRQAIAAAGHRKCLEAGYSNHDTLRRVLSYIY